MFIQEIQQTSLVAEIDFQQLHWDIYENHEQLARQTRMGCYREGVSLTTTESEVYHNILFVLSQKNYNALVSPNFRGKYSTFQMVQVYSIKLM